MKSRLIDKAKDYDVIAPWWPAHGWPGVPVEILPKCGVMVVGDNDTPLAAAWMYMDNSVGVAMMEWAVTNPANTAKQSYMAVTMLVQAVRELALEFDYGVLLTTAKQDALVKMYERNGFQKTDSGMTHLLMLTKG
jgi:hypothetical protein